MLAPLPDTPPPVSLTAGLAGDLREVAALTARMLAASDADDWTMVSSLEGQRFALLSALTPAPVGTDTATMEVILREALEATQRISDRVRQCQATAQNALRVIRTGRQGALTYLENAAP